jgi:sterol 3beta-glucosyltransferase
MKIVITSFGTRGDVQPYLALAVGLQRAGHRVTLATSHTYAKWIQAYGVNAHLVSFNVQEVMQQPETQATLRGRNPVRLFSAMREMMRQGAEAQDEVWAAIQNADFVIQSPTASGALEAVSKRGIPAAFAVPVPFAPTRAFPSFFLGTRVSLGAGYNYFTHQLMHGMLWNAMSGPLTNPLRKKLGLRPWRSLWGIDGAWPDCGYAVALWLQHPRPPQTRRLG